VPKDTFYNLPDEKRQHILTILLEEFAENDYKNVSVSRIVSRAGIAKGSFYQYFEDKKDCYLYLLELAVQEKTAFLRQSPPPGTSLSIFNTLRWLLKAGLRFELSNPRLARISYRAVFDDAPLPEETTALIRSGGMQYFTQLVRQGMQEGDIAPDIDPGVAAFAFNAVFTNLGSYLMERLEIPSGSLLEDGRTDLASPEAQTLMDDAIRVLENGLSPRHGAAV